MLVAFSVFMFYSQIWIVDFWWLVVVVRMQKLSPDDCHRCQLFLLRWRLSIDAT